MRFARLFDKRDASGGWTFDPGRPRVDDPDERARISAFLAAGTMIVRIVGHTDDRIDPARGEVVPMSTHTDGTWIWNASVRYYLDTHGIAPDKDFLAHIVANEYVPVRPDEPTIRAALAELRKG
jgi:hypothetical protein